MGFFGDILKGLGGAVTGKVPNQDINLPQQPEAGNNNGMNNNHQQSSQPVGTEAIKPSIKYNDYLTRLKRAIQVLAVYRKILIAKKAGSALGTGWSSFESAFNPDNENRYTNILKMPLDRNVLKQQEGVIEWFKPYTHLISQVEDGVSQEFPDLRSTLENKRGFIGYNNPVTSDVLTNMIYENHRLASNNR